MSGIMEHILGRRSIRKYTDEPVQDEDLARLLQAAMAAPTASNRRPWEFVVITDPDVLHGLRRGLILGNFQAPAAVVVCGNMERAYPGFARDFWVQDCSAATQNILLAAHGLGLGAVWVGVHPVSLLVSHVRRTLGLPKQVVPLNVIHVGHPAETKEPRTQYDAGRVSWQRYGARRT
ncbi:MAG: nitroreductase family protein [Anaerolineae bacterium]